MYSPSRTPPRLARRLGAAVAFAVIVAMFPAAVQAAVSYRATQAIAQFSIDVAGQETWLLVAAAEEFETAAPGGGPTSRAPVFVALSNETLSLSCLAYLPGAYEQTALRSAQVDAKLECVDAFGMPAASIEVSVAWQAFGALNGPFTYTDHEPGGASVYHLVQRLASASGTLTFGGDTYELGPENLLEAVIERTAIAATVP
jgi:hypothetical protein